MQWHPAFCSAVKLELRKNKDDLIYEKEHNLNSKPIQIDFLVIKKQKEIIITNDIGKIFRKYNIMEYKSPEDAMNIDTYYNTLGYACLYKSYGENVDSISEDDITISLVRDSKPAGLLRHMEKSGMHITNPYHGIFYITGSRCLFPVQIIVSNDLDSEEHIWLKSLKRGLNENDACKLLIKSQAFNMKCERSDVDSVLSVIITANEDVFKKLRRNLRMFEALKELIKDELEADMAKCKEESIAKGMAEGKAEGRALKYTL
ncbi:MAG: hypothetical protein HDT39_09075 [Lachnospiraceae bacterium]|nr:hypothetical protein [Lachnospiraceae bacterium]